MKPSRSRPAWPRSRPSSAPLAPRCIVPNRGRNMTLQIDSGTDAMRHLAILNRIARIAVEDMALRPMLQRVVDTLAEEFQWEFVACACIDAANGEFVCEAVRSTLETDVVVGYRRA